MLEWLKELLDQGGVEYIPLPPIKMPSNGIGPLRDLIINRVESIGLPPREIPPKGRETDTGLIEIYHREGFLAVRVGKDDSGLEKILRDIEAVGKEKGIPYLGQAIEMVYEHFFSLEKDAKGVARGVASNPSSMRDDPSIILGPVSIWYDKASNRVYGGVAVYLVYREQSDRNVYVHTIEALGVFMIEEDALYIPRPLFFVVNGPKSDRAFYNGVEKTVVTKIVRVGIGCEGGTCDFCIEVERGARPGYHKAIGIVPEEYSVVSE